MSRGDWGFLENLLEESQKYSTSVGRVWLTVLFFFRILILCTAAESAWDDEQSDYVCNTKQPGCESVCYDIAFPISHFRYFILQIVFVSTPTILYFGYVTLREHSEPEKEIEGQHGRQRDRKPKEMKLDVITEENDDLTLDKKEKKLPDLRGTLLGAYAVSIILKVLLEVGFIVGLWFLYGFVIYPRYECQRSPCPHTVDCFVSRPTEKTIFTIYMQVIASFSALLNVVELFHLLQLSFKNYLEKKYQYQMSGIPQDIKKTSAKLQPIVVQTRSYQDKGHVYLPAENGSYTQSVKEWTVSRSRTTEDILPTYSNCLSDTEFRDPNRSAPKVKHLSDTHYL